MCTLYTTAKKLNDNLNKNFKRKCRDLNINIESMKKKARMDAKPHYTLGVEYLFLPIVKEGFDAEPYDKMD